jgi:predicted SAM-dependent methyltransferase
LKIQAEDDLPRILDVGCGPTKYPGSIGLDMNPSTAADVLCHLDRGGLPFRDNSFDQVRAEHVIEHVADIIATMEEFHRHAALHGLQLVPRPHAPLAPEHVFLSLFLSRRDAWPRYVVHQSAHAREDKSCFPVEVVARAGI